ncbi:MAG: hypothetical protein ACYDAN_00755 [Candidatus Limnocylindrales bacterium]
MSVATGGVAIGTVALVSGATTAAGSPSAAPAAAAMTIPAVDLTSTAPPSIQPGPSGGEPGTPRSTSNPTAATSAPAPGSYSAPQGASASGEPFDPDATVAGFAGSYRFVAHVRGLPGLTNLGGVVQGVVTDPGHFTLDFPESGFITQYARDGSTARAMINGQALVVQPGEATAGAISPEAMLPAGLWGQAVALWQGMLRPDGTAGSFAANSGALTSKAKQDGLLASDWQLSARTDGLGRLTTLAFSGRSWGQPFALDLVVLYA